MKVRDEDYVGRGVYGKSSIESTVNDFLKKRGLNVVGQRE